MASKVLPPGFRFHPTAVELVMYYLKRKVLGKKLHFEAISVVDIYACRPEELPAKSCVKSGDQKWYFFCPRERRYANGDRAKRSTPEGFWKTTGNDRIVSYNGEPVGKIKTLIFHRGKAPKGERTNWVMHEYRLTDKGLAERGVQQDTFVLCEIFQKDGLGPRNGAQYGAPFREEDWDEEIDVALPESIGTLFPLTEEPQNQCPTSVENGSSMPPITVAGSLSEAGPSDSVQQFLHRPNENVVIEDAEEVTQDDLLMHGIYAHEISKDLNENEKTEDLGNAAAQDNCEVPPDGNEIFKDLDDLELNALMASWYDSTALQNMMDDGSYVELFDLEGALRFTEKSSDLPVVPTTEGLAVIPEELHQVGDHHGQPIGPLNNMLALVPLPKGPHLSGDHPVTTFQDVGVHWSGNEANIASSSVPHQTSLSPTLKRQRDGTSTEDIRRVKKR